MKNLQFNTFRNYAGSTVIGLIMAAVTGCAALSDGLLPAPSAPADLADLPDAELESAQKMLGDRGYELVYSGLSGTQQYWLNEYSKACVSLAIDDHHVAAVDSIDSEECSKRVQTARKPPAKPENYVYIDGKADVKSPSLQAERQQLAYQGYKAVYWIKDAASGRGVEYWLSADGTKCTALVFEITDGTLEMMGAGEPDQCVKPQPRPMN